ncbi:YlxM family DNA-binding protein [Paenibacillus sp. FJAT-26967]|uniref:YlxM family DNA-binding protein n=1 Tax=Paenibacillus sp. FJAT-26967 TaxID=1729690 RepID=UPI0008382B45|nr:YlxM family DNA-binding protein [Paenibacillus sp. FJAT-26967]
MTEDQILEKTNRINLLFDFYEPMLTDKQQTVLKLYFHDDYSLGEIAEQFKISRQAVYEHVKRAEVTLEDYESKLALLSKHERRLKLLGEAEEKLKDSPEDLADCASDYLRRIVHME